MTDELDVYDLCKDCYQVALTGETEFLDEYYGPEAADEQREDIFAGLDHICPDGKFVDVAEEPYLGRTECDSCGTTLLGPRFEVACVVVGG